MIARRADLNEMEIRVSRLQAANEMIGDDAPRFYSASDLAGMFGVCRMTIYRALDDGDIPAIRIRGRWIVPARAVDALVNAALAGRFADGVARAIGGPMPFEGRGKTSRDIGGRPRPGANQTGAGSPVTQQGARGEVSTMPDPNTGAIRGARRGRAAVASQADAAEGGVA
jgi:excisionase family DNA binding protein